MQSILLPLSLVSAQPQSNFFLFSITMLKSWQGNLFMKFCSFCPLVLLVVIVTSKLNFNFIFFKRAAGLSACCFDKVTCMGSFWRRIVFVHQHHHFCVRETILLLCTDTRGLFFCSFIFFFCLSLLQTSSFILVLQIFAWLPQSRLNAISWWNFGHGIFQGSLYFYGLLLLWRNRLASFKVACTAYITPWLLSAATFSINEYKKQQYLVKAIF